jgi:hypothetical protein
VCVVYPRSSGTIVKCLTMTSREQEKEREKSSHRWRVRVQFHVEDLSFVVMCNDHIHGGGYWAAELPLG